jgi:hypothetical protein
MGKDRDKDIHDKAMKDSAKNEYKPPHEKPPLWDLVDPYSDKEIEERKSYREQWRDNRENIKRQRD